VEEQVVSQNAWPVDYFLNRYLVNSYSYLYSLTSNGVLTIQFKHSWFEREFSSWWFWIRTVLCTAVLLFFCHLYIYIYFFFLLVCLFFSLVFLKTPPCDILLWFPIFFIPFPILAWRHNSICWCY